MAKAANSIIHQHSTILTIQNEENSCKWQHFPDCLWIFFSSLYCMFFPLKAPLKIYNWFSLSAFYFWNYCLTWVKKVDLSEVSWWILMCFQLFAHGLALKTCSYLIVPTLHRHFKYFRKFRESRQITVIYSNTFEMIYEKIIRRFLT